MTFFAVYQEGQGPDDPKVPHIWAKTEDEAIRILEGYRKTWREQYWRPEYEEEDFVAGKYDKATRLFCYWVSYPGRGTPDPINATSPEAALSISGFPQNSEVFLLDTHEDLNDQLAKLYGPDGVTRDPVLPVKD